jgi:hypothetical protein
LKGNLRIGSSLTYYKGAQFINSIANTIKAFGAGPTLGLDMSPTDKIDVSLTAGVNYNNTKYSLEPSLNTNYLSHLYDADFNWQFARGFYFNTDFSYSINNQLSHGFNAHVPLWGASLSKLMLKYNRGQLKLRVNDILNQNIGVNRTTNQNYIEDSKVNTLRRYGILTFTYSLTKTGIRQRGTRRCENHYQVGELVMVMGRGCVV